MRPLPFTKCPALTFLFCFAVYKGLRYNSGTEKLQGGFLLEQLTFQHHGFMANYNISRNMKSVGTNVSQNHVTQLQIEIE